MSLSNDSDTVVRKLENRLTGDAACLLAKLPPLELKAGMRGRIFRRIRELRLADNQVLESEGDIRAQKSALLFRQWQLYVDAP